MGKLIILPEPDQDPIIFRLNKFIDDCFKSDLIYLEEFTDICIEYYSDIEEPNLADEQILIKLNELNYWLSLNRESEA